MTTSFKSSAKSARLNCKHCLCSGRVVGGLEPLSAHTETFYQITHLSFASVVTFYSNLANIKNLNVTESSS